MTATKETTLIVLDSSNAVTQVVLSVGTKKKPFNWSMDHSKLILQLHEPLQAKQEATLFISFNGHVNTNSTTGFYASTSHNQIMAISQFETHGAHTVFPCFDDPALKAYFNLNISVEEPYHVISNMDAKKITQVGDIRYFELKRTPRLSSYLVAWAIGNSSYLSSGSYPDVHVYYPGTCSSDYQYAVELTKSTISYFEILFDLKYPNSKLDLFLVPDYTAEGMENFGLITIESKRFPINKQSSFDEKFYIYTLITHEIAHQWFGDIVTMRNWSDLWLNEAFAEYLQYQSVQEIFKGTSNLFYINEFITTFVADSTWSTHSVLGKDDNTPLNLFDDITYNKGAVILSMVSQYMDGTTFLQNCNNFCTSLRLYLRQYAFSNANTNDLMTHLGRDVSKYVRSWLYEPGFPVIYVSIQSYPTEKIIRLQQRRFNVLNKVSKSIWNISVDVKLFELEQDGCIKSREVILDREETSFSIPSKYHILLNAGTKGLYFTHYGDQFRNMVSALSKFRHLFSDIEKAHFIYQAFQLSLSLQLPWADAIKSLHILKEEKSEVVWRTIVNLWFQLRGALNNHPTFDVYKDTVRDMLPSLGHLWPNSSVMVLGALSGSAVYTKALKSIFYSWATSKPIHVNPNYYEAIYHASLTDKENFEVIWSSHSSYPGDTLKALAYTQFPEHNDRLFCFIRQNLSVSDRELYMKYFIKYSPISFKIVWKFIKVDFPVNLKRIKEPLLENVVSQFSQDAELLYEIQGLITKQNGSWDIPKSGEPDSFKFLRRGIEKAIAGLNFRSHNLNMHEYLLYQRINDN